MLCTENETEFLDKHKIPNISCKTPLNDKRKNFLQGPSSCTLLIDFMVLDS